MDNKEYLDVDLFTEEMDDKFPQSSIYKKTVVTEYRIAEAGESLSTVLPDGTVETQRTLEGGEYIIKNPTGEEYALSEENFHALYQETEPGVYVSIGHVIAFPNPYGVPIKIMAPWGEPQYGNHDCMIAQTEEDESDRYLIDKESFEKAYSPVLLIQEVNAGFLGASSRF